jgi:DNA-binding Lrp family transcriptional regulator
MNKKILKMLEADARMEISDIATALSISEKEAADEIFGMEEEGIIKGYKGIIDWDKTDEENVSAVIELKVTPKAGLGFDEVARIISAYPQVESVYLMSGGCDLCVTVRGKSFREISEFLSKELAVIDSVTSTATQFIMKKYKEFGAELNDADSDNRGSYLL